MKSIYARLKSLAFSNGVKLLLACVVVFAISYFYLSYYRNAFYDLTADEGYIIYGAKRVLDGQILYKDFFQFYPPPVISTCSPLCLSCLDTALSLPGKLPL